MMMVDIFIFVNLLKTDSFSQVNITSYVFETLQY